MLNLSFYSAHFILLEILFLGEIMLLIFFLRVLCLIFSDFSTHRNRNLLLGNLKDSIFLFAL